MTILLYRHGLTAYSGEGRYLGRTDVPLCAAGARALARAPFDPGNVYVSPLLRARQSAEILFPGARQIVVPAFAEFDFGAFEGKSALDMADDGDYRVWVESGCLAPCPGGESLSQFRTRCCGAFAALVDDTLRRGEKRLVLVAHSGTLRAVMEGFALPERGYFDWAPPCGGCYALSCDEALWRTRRKLCVQEGAPC